jgi:phosphoglycerate kinase
MTLRTLGDLNLAGRRVFVRVDFNLPIKDGRILDDSRIKAALPTLNYVLEKGGRPVLASHLGRPKGPDPSQSLKPVADRLRELSGRTVIFSDHPCGPEAEAMSKALKPGEILLLENTRFEKGEKDNAPETAQKFRALADVYVNDAFGTAHRADASTHALALLFDERAAGLLMEREVAALSAAVTDPAHPFVAVLGGAKISGKLEVVQALLAKADVLLIGGGMANTFLKAQGLEIGKSLMEPDLLETARGLLDQVKAAGRRRLLLPVDALVTDQLPSETSTTVLVNAVPADRLIADIGPATVKAYAAEIAKAKTLFWNGPMGVFEQKAFAAGTFGIAQAVADCPGFTIVGGGESVAAVEQSGMAPKVKHISTGGGASLEFVAGKSLPALEVLQA